jgi:chemotaxis protein MotC
MKALIAAMGVWAMLVPAFAAEEHEAPAASAEEKAARDVLLNDLDALFLLQDATASGRSDAAALQKPLLVSIGERLSEGSAIGPDTLAPLVAGYVLSGGDPDAAAALAQSDQLSPSHRQLVEGVSLFMRGDRVEAAKLLGDMDSSRLPARIAGRVALAQALLQQDPGARQSGLSTAIAAMPGTLVEESALRRSTLAFAEEADEAGFWRRLDRYQRRFPDSLYARSFWDEVMSNLAEWSSKAKPPDLAKLDLTLMEMPVSRRRDLYLALARQAARINQSALVGFAARRALRLAAAGGREDQTARFYLALYAVASEKVDEARASLDAINRDLLLPHEQALRDAALWVAEEIRRPADPGPMLATSTKEKSALQERSEELLSEVDKILLEINS